MKRLLPLLLAVLFLLPGCANVPAPDPVAASDTPAPLEIEIPQVTPESTPRPTNPPTPSPSPTPTQEPTPTPIPFTLSALPDTVRLKNGFTACETAGVVRRDADGAFFACGAFGDGEPRFYPCDETGAVRSDAVPTDVCCTVPAYTPTDVPKKDGALLLVVYLQSQSVAAFEAQDGDWTEIRVMLCSTGRAGHRTPVGNYTISDRYVYHKLGTTTATKCWGFYACRFTGHYLFHSVPVSIKANSAKKGHSKCDMHKFEQLGTPASDGCVRLSVADAKWVYDLSGQNRVSVYVVDAAGPTPPPRPEVRYEAPYTDKNGYGWDPTDPDPDNPYRTRENP